MIEAVGGARGGSTAATGQSGFRSVSAVRPPTRPPTRPPLQQMQGTNPSLSAAAAAAVSLGARRAEVGRRAPRREALPRVGQSRGRVRRARAASRGAFRRSAAVFATRFWAGASSHADRHFEPDATTRDKKTVYLHIEAHRRAVVYPMHTVVVGAEHPNFPPSTNLR